MTALHKSQKIKIQSSRVKYRETKKMYLIISFVWKMFCYNYQYTSLANDDYNIMFT